MNINTNTQSSILQNNDEATEIDQTAQAAEAAKPYLFRKTFAEDLKQHFTHIKINIEHGEINITIIREQYLALLIYLKNTPDLHFEQLIDLCGADYSEYPVKLHEKNTLAEEKTHLFAVCLQLLSIKNNQRLRVRCYLSEWDLNIPSINEIWASANWYEREAFDLYGICFMQHPDLRRILTDYDFIGHPLRKDFPTSGFVEMRYDEDQKRVIYQPVTIEPREITPRIFREANYAK
jgi:NADH-quinone oxidoreductase subunit C